MSCASFEKLLLDFVDLPTQERAAIDRHLVQCRSCRQYSDTLSQLDFALTEQFPSVQPSERLHSRLNAVKSSPSGLNPPSFLPELLDLIGGAGIVLCVSLVVWKMFPMTEISDFIPDASIVLPVCASLVLFAIAFLGARAYAEMKS